jgi:regulator of sirC expression with transglutaminase-like and TPR domain
VNRAAVSAALDDHARALFGIATLPPVQRARRLGEVLDRELGLRPVEGPLEPGAFLLEHVLSSRRGHPALLAVVAHELAQNVALHLRVRESVAASLGTA